MKQILTAYKYEAEDKSTFRRFIPEFIPDGVLLLSQIFL